MYRYLVVLTVFLAILSNSRSATCQTTTKTQSLQNDAVLAANGSVAVGGSSNRTEGQNLSRQANDEAKRLYRTGVKYGRAGFFRQAAESFQKAIEINPDYEDAHYGLGHANFDLGYWEEAIRSFEMALKLNPKDSDAREKLGEANLRLGRETKPPIRSEKPVAATVPVSLTTPAAPRPAAPAETLPAVRTDLTRVYRVGVGDVLDVRLSDAPATQSTLFTVAPLGLLEHPILAEPLAVAGLTVEEIEAKFEADLKRRAVSENPKVSVGVREYLSHAIIVSGLVKDPGTKILRREAIPLYVVIADAQPAAEAGRVSVIRHDSGEAQISDLTSPTEMNLLVRPGDVITVHPNPKQYFYIGGEVKTPGEKPFRPGITLTQAILTAGGLSRDSKEAHLARDGGNGFLSLTRYKLKDINSGKMADPSIQAGDRITIED
ncbi:MAG: tetratricopeptide repeat protein [Acidobacteriota bacterium]